MSPRQSAQEKSAGSAVNKKPAAGGAVTLPAAGNNAGIGTVQLTLFVILFGALCGAAWIGHSWLEQRDQRNYQRGLADKQVEWDKDKERAAELERQRKVAVAEELLAVEKGRAAAEDRARDAEAKWEEARREARNARRPSVVCPQPGPDRGPVAPGRSVADGDAGEAARVAGVDDHRPAGPVLTWGFVLDYDAAWTGIDGKPVFGNSSGGEESAAASAASPYTPDDALDVHGLNARRCSEDRRQLAGLIERLERAKAAWDKAGGQK